MKRKHAQTDTDTRAHRYTRKSKTHTRNDARLAELYAARENTLAYTYTPKHLQISTQTHTHNGKHERTPTQDPCSRVSTHTRTKHKIHPRAKTQRHTLKHKHTNIHTYTSTHTHTLTQTHADTHRHTYKQTYAHTYARACTYVYKHTHCMYLMMQPLATCTQTRIICILYSR